MEYHSFVASYLFAGHEPRDSLDGKRTKIMSKEQRAAVDAQLRAAAFDASRAPGELREAFAAMMAGPPPSGVTLTPALDRAGRFVLDRLAPVPAGR
jgi:hypothetical protein